MSALVFGGRPREVTDLIADQRLTTVMSEEIMTELRRIVAAKFPQFGRQITQLETLLRRYSRWVQLGSIMVAVCRDPDDDRVIETAIIGGCQYIVSGDKDLLAVASYQGIRIVAPAEFLVIMR